SVKRSPRVRSKPDNSSGHGTRGRVVLPPPRYGRGVPAAGTVIVGAGIGGLRTAEQLRRRGYADPVVLVGAEDEPPYDRPPMSKEVLTGERDPASTIFRKVADFAEIGVDVLL